MEIWLSKYLLLLAWCITPGGSTNMPVGSFFSSMFFAGGEDEEPPSPIVVETITDGAPHHRDFSLDISLYSEFNEIGKAQFSILKDKGLDSPCWRDAATSIEADCETMTHTRKQRLAVQLNNCHLQDTGRRRTRCWAGDSDQRCVEETKHDDVAFHSYTTFFHHVNVICYHLSHNTWQQETESLVQGLTASSLATFERAERSLEKQEQVLEAQRLAAEQSETMVEILGEARTDLAGLSDNLSMQLTRAVGEIEKQETLMTTLLASQAQAASQASVFSSELGSAKSELESYLRAIEDDRRAAQEQNTALADTIAFIHHCLENATSAWARFQAFTYMILSANLCWVVTTPTPLRSARTSVFILVAFGLLVERCLCEDVSPFASSSGAMILPSWVIAGLNLATSRTFTVTTWTKLLIQEQIRWLTFQACCAVLGHALIAYFIPCLEVSTFVMLIGGILLWICRKIRRWGTTSPGKVRPPYVAEGGYVHATSGMRAEVQDNQELSRAYSDRSLLALANGSWGDRCDGEQDAQLEEDSDSEDGSGSDGEVQIPPKRESQFTARHGRRTARQDDEDDVSTNRAVSDGLELLSRKELQELAAKTNGRVKGNISTVEMIRALRRESAGVVASEP